MKMGENIKELKNTLNLDFSQGPSQSKKAKYETCVLETPEFAKIVFTHDGPESKKTKYESVMLATPDLQKMVISTPELDRLAMKSVQNFSLPPLTLPTPFLQNDDSSDDKSKIAELFANCNPKLQTKSQEQIVAENTVGLGQYAFNSNSVDSLITADDHKQSVDQVNLCHDQMGPINMDEQERIKLERKRFRNRIAASKCRQRKLERISKLETRVSKLSSKNDQLQRYINTLEDLVTRLNAHIMTHKNLGCDIRERAACF